MWRLFVVSCVAGVLAGCGRGDFALQVQVTAPQGSASRCTKVTATRGADSLESDSATISGGGQVDVLIALDSAAAVTVQAAGYDNVDCMGAPIEQSEQRAGTPTKTAPFPVVVLTLAPVATNTDGGTDAGFDGGFDGGMNDGGMDDGGFDGGTDDGGFDAGTDDAGFDAGTDDAGTDAGLDDAGMKDDAGTVDCESLIPGESCAGGTGVCNKEGACIANFPYTPSNFDVSDLPATDGGVVLSVTGNVTINTDNATIVPGAMPPFRFINSDAGYAQVMVIHLDQLDVASGGTLTFNGATPVIIAVSGDATVDGNVKAWAGAASTTLCGSSQGANGVTGASGGGGAGGGGFGSAGGRGGISGPPNGTGAGAGGDGGLSSGSETLLPLRGGCSGGNGGSGGGLGGSGGGAFQLSSAGTLIITGVVAAPGSGGAGAASGRGGGGGGSGGSLLLEAWYLQLTQSARSTANGGGGAGGGGNGSSASGSAGDVGHLGDATPADGGVGGNGGNYDGSNGGSGGVSSAGATNGAGTNGGGGGGGGGVGRIRFNANSACINTGAVISPTQTTNGGAFSFDAGC